MKISPHTHLDVRGLIEYGRDAGHEEGVEVIEGTAGEADGRRHQRAKVACQKASTRVARIQT